MRYRHIFFDLDGTLTDSAPGILNAIAHALSLMGLSVERNSLVDLIGPPLHESFKRRFGLNDAEAEHAIQLQRDYYRDKGIFENSPYPGIPDMLTALRAAGAELVLATSKLEFFAQAVLRHFDLDGHFSFIAAMDEARTRADKSAVLRYALQHSTAHDPASCIMVGDTRYDVEGAHNVGLPCIGVSYGYGGKAGLRQAGAEFIVDSVADLQNFLLS